ncbi:MAG: AN1-type zinc finger domain-containing protein [Candidatus Ranarchaeia archaeon]
MRLVKRVCGECGKSLSELPFVCKFCGGQYCSEHRLPESHNCTRLEDARKKPQNNEVPPTDDADALEIPEKIVKRRNLR